ncbi:MAG: hypothetical protein WBK28_01305 [Minisyncoccia bacterium]
MAKKESEVLVENEAMEDNHAEPRVYELGFHIDSELSVEEARKVFERVRTTIEKVGTLVAVGDPQKIPLAYTVSRTEVGERRDFTASFFSWIAYEADGKGHEAVQECARGENTIFRFIDIRTDKEAAQHFAEMQEILAKAPEAEHSEEEVSDTEIDKALKEVSV